MLGPVGRGRGYWPGVEKIPGDFSGGILAGGWLVTGDRSEYDGATYQLDPRGLIMHLTVTPAYGRDYKNQRDTLADWHAGKDFVVATFGPDMGRYINNADAGQFLPVMIRYNRLRSTVMVVAVKS